MAAQAGKEWDTVVTDRGTSAGGSDAQPPPPEQESVITPQMRAELDARQRAEAVLAAGGDPRRAVYGNPNRDRWRYSRSRFEQAMRNYDEVIASGGSHPLYQDLVRGASQYWEEMGFASARGGPDGRGFFDKERAKAYIRQKFGPNGYTEKAANRPDAFAAPGANGQAVSNNPYVKQYQRLLDKKAAGGQLSIGESRFLQNATYRQQYDAWKSPAPAAAPPASVAPGEMYAGGSQYFNESTGMYEMDGHSIPPTVWTWMQENGYGPTSTPAAGTSATTDSSKPTTLNQAGPGTAAAQATSGQQGATTNTTPPTQATQQNQQTQFRSQRTGYSGNRRFHPFGG